MALESKSISPFTEAEIELLLQEGELEVPQPNSPAWRQRVGKPEWLKIDLRTQPAYAAVRATLRGCSLGTVCQEAQCPNRSECWNAGTATFLVMGEICTRNCAYCAVRKGRPQPLDPQEPERLAQAVGELGLEYVVLTSVDRDDLPDGGASHLAAIIETLHKAHPRVPVEVLIPDFSGNLEALETVLAAGPQVLNHNVETVPRLYPRLRSRGNYETCQRVLSHAKRLLPAGTLTKSGLMVGLGESHREVIEVMRDLRRCGVDVLTIGQYLRPSLKNVPVLRYRSAREFEFYAFMGRQLGFKWVESSPLTRSSYRAKGQADSLLGASSLEM